MTNSARTLFHDAARAPVAVLLIVLGLCAGLSPLAGSGQTARAAQGSFAFARLAASPLPAQASERLAVASRGTVDERDSSLDLPPSFPLSQLVRWIELPVFGGQPVAGLRPFSAGLYQARAPPAV
jgi:hypothetical protein